MGAKKKNDDNGEKTVRLRIVLEASLEDAQRIKEAFEQGKFGHLDVTKVFITPVDERKIDDFDDKSWRQKHAKGQGASSKSKPPTR